MRRLETVYRQGDQAVLVEGESVAAEFWSLGEDSVLLHDAGMNVVASGPAGPLGQSILPHVEGLKVISVGSSGVTQIRTLPKAG